MLVLISFALLFAQSQLKAHIFELVGERLTQVGQMFLGVFGDDVVIVLALLEKTRKT